MQKVAGGCKLRHPAAILKPLSRSVASAAFPVLLATTLGASWWLSRSLLLPLADAPDGDFVVLSRPRIEFIAASVGGTVRGRRPARLD